MPRKFLAIAALALCSTAVRADLDPETDSPYHLQIILRFARHPVLTDVFRDQVKREVRDNLRAALGNLARVEVTPNHPLLKEVESKGLQHALDGWNFVANGKLHFVFIDFVNGRYEIQTRQYDGLAGLASPVVRSSQTATPQLVSRNASLLIDQDFGLVGTLTKVNDGERVEVALKGSGLGVPVDRWVKKSEVFAVTQIVNPGGAGQRAFRQRWTLLQALDEPKDGVCLCQLYHRYDNPLPRSSGVLGYRCLKLGTIRAPVRLRVVSNDKLATPLNGRRVQIGATGFQSAAEQKATNPDGFVQSEQSYLNIAFVKVLDVTTPLAQLPVEIVDDRTIPVPVSVVPDAEPRGQLYLRRDRWLRRVYESLEVAISLVKDLNATVDQSREQALAKAEAGLKGLEADLANLTEERDTLRKDGEQLAKGNQLDLKLGEERLQELENHRQKLRDYIKELSEIIKSSNDPKKKKWQEMAAQARLMEDAADYNLAIATYEAILSQGAQDKQLQEELNKLKRAWAIKDDAHRKARTFIYETWPKLEKAGDMKSKVARARMAFEACKEAGDVLSPRKLYKTNVALSAKLAQELQSLRVEDNEDDRKTAGTIETVAGDLKQLSEDIAAYLKQAQGSGKGSS
jgi:hypothetical protein